MSEEERAIFGYTVNGVPFFADPLIIARRLAGATGGRLAALVREAQLLGPADDPGDTPEMAAEKEARRAGAQAQALAACAGLLAAAYFAFEQPALDRTTGKGVTATEMERVLAEWFEWVAKKNGSLASTPTSAPPTAPAPSPYPMRQGLASG